MTSFRLLICSLLLLTSTNAFGVTGRCAVSIINDRNETISLSVEIARTDAERNLGLMHRKSLSPEEGMLFVFRHEQIMNFWMKNTSVPLSIAYIDRFGIIREIYDMKPLDTSITYMSKNPALYALEVNRGWFARHSIVPGCKVKLHGCIGK